MPLWPRPADETAPPDLDEISREVHGFGRGRLPDWEAGYLEYHRRRYQDTLRLLPSGGGRRLLDVGSFPGHLSALAQGRGWEVTGLNNAIEGGGAWADFLDRCGDRTITIRECEVEQAPFPLPTASMDAVLFCELFEHLHLNPFHTLKEIFRVLRPGGLLVLTTPNLRRVETLSRLWHGWGTQPPVSRAFHELFPSLLYHRHNREYTADELAYYLAFQGKDLYDFRLDRVYYSDALDAPHEIPGVLGRGVGPRELRLTGRLRRLFPKLRGQLMARAWRTDATLVEWSALRAVEGFGPVEEDARPSQGFTRRLTFPFRLTDGRAAFEVPLPAGEGPALVSLVVANPDGEAPPLRTDWALDGAPAATVELGVSARPVRIHLLVPETVAARGAVRVELGPRRGAIPTGGARSGSMWARSGCWPSASPGPRRSSGPSPGSARSGGPRSRSRGGGSPRRASTSPTARSRRRSSSDPATRTSSARDGSGGRRGASSARCAGAAGAPRRTSATTAAPGKSACAPTRASRGSVRYRGDSSWSAWRPMGAPRRPGRHPSRSPPTPGRSCPCRSRPRPGSCESHSTPSRCGCRAIACPARVTAGGSASR